MFIFLLCITFFAFFLMYLAERVKHPIAQWMGAIFPPLPLFGLIMIPIDMITTLLWLIGFIACLVSMGTLVKAPIAYWRGKHQEKSTLYRQLLRPCLTIIAVVSAYTCVSMSVTSANAYALEKALAIEQTINNGGSCPREMKGWTPEDRSPRNALSLRYGTYGTKYRILYTCNPETSEFTLDVRINIDDSFSIVFKPNQKLKVTFWGKDVWVNEMTDLDALAKRNISSE